MKKKRDKTICIIGAGFAGREIAAEIAAKGILGRVTSFLDDDPEKINTFLDGVPVYGPIAEAERLLMEHPADEALIAIPGAGREQLKRFYRILQRTDLKRIRILPGISQIIDGDAHLIQTREITAQDLMARNPVDISLKESLEYLRGKRVLITGAGGSIGSELARQLLSGGAQRLYLFDHGENSVYEIDKELKILQEEGVGKTAVIVPVIGEMQDRDYMRFIIGRLKADVIFHCAAHKHVPLMESNPIEVIKNNVFGTKNLIDAARDAHTERFVLISTDKAVEPTSIYGVSKAIAEELVLTSNGNGNAFMVVRFGNVLGSQGSIVPLFTKQILKGGPITITHPDATRFFMTIPEAASLVLKAGGVGEEGNLYILDMGVPQKIKDLAEQMIRFYGYQPETEIPVKYIGLRPGEKIHEALWGEGEIPEKTRYPGIIRASHHSRFNGELENLLTQLKPFCFFIKEKSADFRNRKKLRQTLRNHVSTLVQVPDESEY